MQSFVNFSNHPSQAWDQKQTEAARRYGYIVDVPFPNIEPHFSEEEIRSTADRCVEIILSHQPKAVLCQGEYTLTFEVVSRLKAKGVECLSACSDRVSVEELLPGGKVSKSSVYQFVKFRKYL